MPTNLFPITLEVSDNCGWRPTPLSVPTVTFILHLINKGLTNCPVIHPHQQRLPLPIVVVDICYQRLSTLAAARRKARGKERETIWVMPPAPAFLLSLYYSTEDHRVYSGLRRWTFVCGECNMTNVRTCMCSIRAVHAE